MSLSSGHTAKVLDGEELADHQSHFQGFTEGLVRLSPGGWLLETTYLRLADKIYDFKFKDDDVVVMTHPKCGTTWIQELVWTMRNNASLNHPLAHTPVNTRSPFIEADTLGFGRAMSSRSRDDPMLASFFQICPGANPEDGVFLQIANATPSPRTLKTHLPFSLIAPSMIDNAKVVYGVRNPKDMCISFHHHCRLYRYYDFVGSFDQFIDHLVNDDLIQGPYWEHMKEACSLRNHPNVYLLSYEDLKHDLQSTLTSLDKFLGTNLSQDQLRKIGDYCSWEKMKERSGSVQTSHNKNNVHNIKVLEEDGSCFRKGVVGDWKNKLNSAQEKKIDDWIKKNSSQMDIDFKYV